MRIYGLLPQPVSFLPDAQTTEPLDNPQFTDFINFGKKPNSVTIIDQERVATRSSSNYRLQYASYFSRAMDSVTKETKWIINYGAELNLRTSGYEPLWNAPPADTFERHIFAGPDPSNGANYVAKGYREIYIINNGAMYNFLNTNAEGGINSNEALCRQNNAANCDYGIVSGQVWAKADTSHFLGLDYSALFAKNDSWINYVDAEHGGGYSYFMDQSSDNTHSALGATMEATTYASMSYTTMTATQLGTLPSAFNIAGQAAHEAQPMPFASPVNPNLDLQEVMMLRHYSGCSNDPALAAASPDNKCTVFEVHVYGRSSRNNICDLPQPLGLLGIIIGTTNYGNGNKGDIVNSGFLVYQSQ